MGLADLDALGLLDSPAKSPRPEPTSLEAQAARLRREPRGALRDALRESVADEIRRELAAGALARVNDDAEEARDAA